MKKSKEKKCWQSGSKNCYIQELRKELDNIEKNIDETMKTYGDLKKISNEIADKVIKKMQKKK